MKLSQQLRRLQKEKGRNTAHITPIIDDLCDLIEANYGKRIATLERESTAYQDE